MLMMVKMTIRMAIYDGQTTYTKQSNDRRKRSVVGHLHKNGPLQKKSVIPPCGWYIFRQNLYPCRISTISCTNLGVTSIFILPRLSEICRKWVGGFRYLPIRCGNLTKIYIYYLRPSPFF